MSGAVATRNSPTTLARLARWLGGMISPPRAPLFRPQHDSPQHASRRFALQIDRAASLTLST